MDKILFLDLENTIIDDFTKGASASLTRYLIDIRDFIRHLKPNTVKIFSFAIYNKEDAKQYELNFKSWLQDVLDVELDSAEDIFKVEEHVANVLKAYKTRFDSVSEYIQLMGKTQGFFQFLDISHFKNSKIILIDDVVTTGIEFNWKQRNLESRLINVSDVTNLLTTM